jgi:hypothetical protein
MNKKEFKRFGELILQQPRFDSKQMAIRWMAGVDGEGPCSTKRSSIL